MIKNKTVTVIKENRFDKGWTLFQPFDAEVFVNRSFCEKSIADIVRSITFSNTVNVILSEVCLPSRVIAELEWVNNDIRINVIAKSDDILLAYSQLSFSSAFVDPSVTLNCIGIHGKEDLYITFSDGFSVIDNSIDNLYFGNKKEPTADYAFLDSARAVYFISDNKGGSAPIDLLSEAKKRKRTIRFISSVDNYSKQVFSDAKQKEVELLVSNHVRDGIIIVTENYELVSVNLLKGNAYVSTPIKNTSSYFGNLYKCCFLPDVLNSDELKNDYYCCSDGKIDRLNVEETKIINVEIKMTSMEQFINAQFDSSITDSHNDYSALAKNVQYRFTLIPPLFDDSYVESHIYDGIHRLTELWKTSQNIDFDGIRSDYSACLSQDYGLMALFDATQNFSVSLNRMVKKIDYKQYYDVIHKILNTFQYTKDKLNDILSLMFNEINAESSSNKFDKFDAEIDGYRRTIKEKEILIGKGIEVLSNKRRIEILNKKIQDLIQLKDKFFNGSASSSNKKQEQFINRCSNILSGKAEAISGESIENIVKTKEETRSAKLDSFISKYLYELGRYIENCINILKDLSNEKIPTDYIVYEKNKQRYVVIDTEQAFFDTEDIREEFNLLCLARR